jgi:hypothetical protein
MLGIFALVGILVIGFAVAVASGLVSIAGMDPFKNSSAATQPATRPTETVAATDPNAEAEAAVAALENQGYKAGMIYLSAPDARLDGPRIRLERTGYTTYSPRGNVVDPKNRLPNGVIRGWIGPEDSATWSFNCPQAGKYAISFVCTSGGNKGGSHAVAGGKFDIISGASKITQEVEADVRGKHAFSSSYHDVAVGEIDLAAGDITLKIQPAERDTNLLAIRSVRLIPVE